MLQIKYLIFALFLIGLVFVVVGVTDPGRTVWLYIGAAITVISGVALQTRRKELETGGVRYRVLFIASVLLVLFGLYLDIIAER